MSVLVDWQRESKLTAAIHMRRKFQKYLTLTRLILECLVQGGGSLLQQNGKNPPEVAG